MELNIINTIRSKEKQETTVIVSNINDKVLDLKNIIIQSLKLKLSPLRIGLFITEGNDKKVFLSNNERKLRDYGIIDKMTITVKDLGPQISWRLTYIIEYLGPFIIVILLFLRLDPSKANLTQKLGFMMSTFHYGKRIIESMFIHEFSNSTMPFKNLFINCSYYWILYGVVCGYSLLNPYYEEPNINYIIRYICVFFFFASEIKNLRCHLILKDLKSKNKGEKGIPDGDGFEYVSCANYFWEFISWLSFSIFVNSISFYIFTLCGFYQMNQWAQKRHKDYLKNFPDRYPKNRKAFIPFIL